MSSSKKNRNPANNSPTLANTKIKANLFTLIKKREFDKITSKKILRDSHGLPQEHKFKKIKFYALVICRNSINPFFNVSLLGILKIDT